ncbi:hypothetical protein SDC9_52981 [bioreactor metagenome]|uniref:Uncharacterized protein n=1 Tax=bioreactor metagenome TaxID=1076179 RepID=A0A644WSK6_9ZZZZ
MLYFSCEGEHLGPLGLLRAHGCVPRPAVAYDLRYVGPCLHVIDVRGASPEPGVGRKRRAGTGHAPAPLYGCHEGSLLAADESPGTLLDVDLERKAAFHDVFTKEAVLLRLGHGRLQPLDRKGILCPAVDIPFVGAHGVCAQHHALDDTVRIPLEDRTVHERSGIALVRVADDVFLVAFRGGTEAPLETRRESSAPTAPET